MGIPRPIISYPEGTEIVTSLKGYRFHLRFYPDYWVCVFDFSYVFFYRYKDGSLFRYITITYRKNTMAVELFDTGKFYRDFFQGDREPKPYLDFTPGRIPVTHEGNAEGCYYDCWRGNFL